MIGSFFFRHGDVDTSSFTYVASQLDCVLQTHAESSNDGTGEEDAQRVNQVYNTLCKQIRALELPLSVSSLQGISPVFRGAEVVDRGYCQPFCPYFTKSVRLFIREVFVDKDLQVLKMYLIRILPHLINYSLL